MRVSGYNHSCHEKFCLGTSITKVLTSCLNCFMELYLSSIFWNVKYKIEYSVIGQVVGILCDNVGTISMEGYVRLVTLLHRGKINSPSLSHLS